MLADLLSKFWPHIALLAVSLLAWHFDSRAVANADTVRTQAENFKSTQAAASVIAKQALLHQQEFYEQKAKESEDAHQKQLDDARSYADNYIATHRLRTKASERPSGTAAASAQGDGAAVSPVVPADAVVVSAGDVQVCTSAVTYGIAAHNWAVSIIPPPAK
jgi:hypothetical protein